VEGTLQSFIAPDEQAIVRSPFFTTVVKQRFVEPKSEGKELSKLFSVNFIDREQPDEHIQEAVLQRIAGLIRDFDLVIVADFGHGLMEDRIRRYVEDKAAFLAVNCQTNSNNFGFNILNRRYQRADSFSLDHTEITLAVGRRQFNHGKELEKLCEQLKSCYGWLTVGAKETLGCRSGHQFCSVPPFECNVVDTLGAGDAFCSAAFLAAVDSQPLEIATFVGQLAGAQAVRIVGNSAPIRKASFLKGANSLLAY
jgi:sugar/nucleoside kinase (ribokinase family)